MTLVRERALKFGDFTLASGKRASFYLDMKQITLSSAGARLVGEGILELIGNQPIAAVGGMSIGAVARAVGAARDASIRVRR